MKANRQQRIVELINEKNIETQEELANLLREEGYDVTQATVSRDIRKLGLTKVSVGGGHQKYTVMKEGVIHAKKYTTMVKETIISVDTAMNIVVIKTVSGMAMAAAAGLDHLELDGVVGSIAGDDTIFLAVRTTEDAEKIKAYLYDMVKR